MLLTSSCTLDILIFLAIGIYYIFRFFSTSYQYWAKRDIYSPKPVPIFGHFLEIALLRTSLSEWLKHYYDKIDKKYFGLYIFNDPFFIPKDPEIIKNIIIKDFGYFHDRCIASPQHDVVQQNILFMQKSTDWRNARIKLTPVFSSGKLKGMFHLIDACAVELRNWVDENLGINEAKELASKFSTNVTARCAFGINPECFVHEKSVFKEMGEKFFNFTWRNALVQIIYTFKPKWVDILKLNFIEKEPLHYFQNIFVETLENRPHDQKYNDLIDNLKELRKNNNFGQEESENCKLAGISIQFFLAGFETTSSVISFTLYEFGMNPEVQATARKEVQTILSKHNEKVSYNAVKEMVYLEMCINETLRKYPVVPFLERKCNKDYKIPDTDVVIEKGTAVFIPLYGLQMDEKYFPEPLKYDPNRFLNKIDATNGLYYMPFGEGPRMCIGERFGRISIKAALIYILTSFEIKKCNQTPDPIQFEPKSFFSCIYSWGAS